MEHLLRLSQLYNFSQIHDCDPVAHIVYSAQAVSHKQAGQMKVFLQLAQQIEDLRLYGNIQRADRLITHKESGL